MIRKILVPIDGSAHAKKAVVLASDIASKYRGQIVLLHVLLRGATASELRKVVSARRLSRSAQEMMRRFERIQLSAATMPDSYVVSIPMPDEVLESVGSVVMDDAEAIARKHGVKRVKRIIKPGRPAQVILTSADAEKADMIVMGSRGLGDFRGMLLGSVSHKVSNLSRYTCVTVK